MLLLLVALTGLPGCGGLVGVIRGSGPFELQEPSLQILSPPRPATIDDAVRRRAATLRAFWGEPAEVEPLADGRERWRYPTGIRWHGIALLVVVVPVPLLIPTGRHHVDVFVQQGRIAKLRGTAGATVARAGCAFGIQFVIGRTAGCGWQGRRPPLAVVEHRGLRIWEAPRPVR